jgi:Na+/H+ antiporter NhaA
MELLYEFVYCICGYMALFILNGRKYNLIPYPVGGVECGFLCKPGVHATITGVLLACNPLAMVENIFPNCNIFT